MGVIELQIGNIGTVEVRARQSEPELKLLRRGTMPSDTQTKNRIGRLMSGHRLRVVSKADIGDVKTGLGIAQGCGKRKEMWETGT